MTTRFLIRDPGGRNPAGGSKHSTSSGSGGNPAGGSGGTPARRRLDDGAEEPAPTLCPLEPDEDRVLVPVIEDWLAGAACALAAGEPAVTVTHLGCVVETGAEDSDGAAVFAPHPALAARLVWDRCAARWHVGCATNRTGLLAAGVAVAVGLGDAGASTVGGLAIVDHPPPGARHPPRDF